MGVTYSGDAPAYPEKKRNQDWRIRKRSKEKPEKNARNVPITFRLNEDENRYLKNCAAACGLSAEVHTAFKKCVPYFHTAAEICKEIERLAVDLQQRFTMPQPFDIEDYAGKGAV